MRTSPTGDIRSILPLGEPVEPRTRQVHRLRLDRAAARRALVDGLRAEQASIAPRYFYDPLGNALFGAICALPEYYLTRVEQAIFTRHRSAIAAAIGRGNQLVDLGAGDGAKAEAWLPFLAPSRYLAVDIAAEALQATLARLGREFADLELLGVVTDFTAGLDLRADLADAPVTFFYPGSSIGNFAPAGASELLVDIRRHCTAKGSGLLIGVDTRKDAARLEAAYADRLGVTAAFNRNVLLHVNRLLGCDFDPQAFDHQATWDPRQGRVEMHLVASREIVVRIDGVPRRFATGERIHTENSYKYAPAEFAAILEAVGFASVRLWQDEAGDFAVYYAS